MQPMKLKPLYGTLIDLEVIDPTIRKALPMQIVDGFEALKAKRVKEDLSDDELRALFECSLLLTSTDYRGSGSIAQDVLMDLYAKHAGFEFRTTAQADAPPEAEPEEIASPL